MQEGKIPGIVLSPTELIESGKAFSLKSERPDDQVFHMKITVVGAVMQYIKIVNLDFRRKKYSSKTTDPTKSASLSVS